MKILILGGTGMLGYELFSTCIRRQLDVKTVVRSNRLLMNRPGINAGGHHFISIDDIKNTTALENSIREYRPDVVVNCVGIIKQSALAENHFESIAINAFLPHQLEKMGQQYGFRLIHISTDCVFNGRKGMYTENDLSDAEDLYGKTKFLGEVGYGQGITLRTSIIGHEISGQQHGLVDWFLAQQGTVNGYTKAIFSGLTTTELTKVILDIIIPSGLPAGIYQVAAEPIAKYDLLQLVAKVYNKDIQITPSEKVIIDRSLSGEKFRHLTGYTAPVWETMIAEMHKGFTTNF
jgi:dTDP-4-dehydrorhamnose reductase